MYFQIENTPEHIRRSRCVENVPKESPEEECPLLILAPFSRPPQVVFDNVLIGSSCERDLEVYNPSKQMQKITLGKALPPGLVIHLPGEWLELEPETCYCLQMMWTPTKPTAMRETIRFTNDSRGRFDVIVVLKSAMNLKGKNNQPKGFKTSPGKMKTKLVSKKSPVSIYKKKAEIIYKTTKVKKTINVVQSTQHKVYQTFNKENINDYSIDTYHDKCPFDSPTSLDLNFNTSEIFSNMKKTNILQETYDKSYTVTDNKLEVAHNVLRPSNKQNCDTTATSMFDNINFTPLKSLPSKTDRLDQGPKIIFSVNSDSDFDDSLNLKSSNKENQTHSIISVTSSQPPNKWLTVNHTHLENECIETPTVPNKKHPNTSSPKEHSPNFSINTDFSRISELSFLPQRFSTERKCFPKINESQEMLDEKLSCDTYTKDSPKTPIEHTNYQTNMERPPHYFSRDQPKMCRQSLFREYQQQREAYDKNYMNMFDHNAWQNELRVDTKSPPRSITPPLQSIPEESTQFSDTQVLDKTDKMATFTIDRTFDRPEKHESSMSTTKKQTWSKKAIRVEPDLWKVPVTHIKKSIKQKAVAKTKDLMSSRMSNVTFESNQNITVNQIGNIYSQSTTVDPFLSATYFYDEEAVHKFENEFKRWLNCILTPPADLESNVEQKIDVGKAWIENRNKEVPLAPTKEQVSSAYHNSHRLESLRRSARNLLMMPEMALVFQKLNVQIEKKLIAVRTDRNLHLDVGLQKTIMEVLLSYNPLWLRIGLEAIYGLVLPLKSNSDIEGLTTFIIQRMFKNPFLKNKHSKSSAPNMLLPAYMEAIKKFTLKKFFMLVFFLDQAKQRKLISHDPCLFCRNAICKESREILIRFTREVIAGIGDITRHLRPLGYVVCHKQSYLDEYKYAVHNLALDIRDGVRLTKVMEIITMKNGLTNQLRTPAISRLQKIHNVQVAMNALKVANFVIDGEITATDIADGHREKTLSLLWQLIHVFRAPLFEKAANVIQTWWRKKYEVIMAERKEEERIRNRLTNAVSVIQCWWRKIKYNREVEWRMQQITRATIVVQKYCRMWLCRTRIRRFKTSVLKIEEWFRSVQLMREAKNTLTTLRIEREQLRHKCATVIQSHVRRWLCVKRYKMTLQRIYEAAVKRQAYLKLTESAVVVQRRYRALLAMRKDRSLYLAQKTAAIAIQRRRRANNLMLKTRQEYTQILEACKTIQNAFRAYVAGKRQMTEYLKIKTSVILIQRRFRKLIETRKSRYLKLTESAVVVQRRYKALLAMRRERTSYLANKKAAILIQRKLRANNLMLKTRIEYTKTLEACKTIQTAFRAYVAGKRQRTEYFKIKTSVILIQRRFRKLIETRKARYLKLTESAVVVQTRYRGLLAMKKERSSYLAKKKAAITIQRRLRAYNLMLKSRLEYTTTLKACKTIQNAFRAYVAGKRQRTEYLKMKTSVILIQRRFRKLIETRKARYLKLTESAVVVQRRYRGLLAMRKERSSYLAKKTAAITIQRRLRAYNLMLKSRLEYTTTLKACKTIQNAFRAYVASKRQKTEYLKIKMSVILIQRRFRKLIETRKARYLKLTESAVVVQRRYRGLLAMRKERSSYLEKKTAANTIQRKLRANNLMLKARQEYKKTLNACETIQNAFRAYVAGKRQRTEYLKIKTSVILIQTRFRMLIETRKVRYQYLQLRKTVVLTQRRFRANQLSLSLRRNEAARKIQIWYRSVQKRDKCRKVFLLLRKQVVTVQSMLRMYFHRKRFLEIRTSTLTIQRYYRSYKLTTQVRHSYIHVRSSIVTLQSYVRSCIARKRFLRLKAAVSTIQAAYKLKKQNEYARKRRESAAICLQKYIRRYLIQTWYRRHRQNVLLVQEIWRGKLLTRLIHCEYLQKRRIVINIQSVARGYLVRKEFQLKKEHMLKLKELRRQSWAASKIQALFRGNKERVQTRDTRVRELRRKWRAGGLQSTQQSLKERNDDAMEVLRHMSGIDAVIRAFESLKLLTEVFPMLYNHNARAVVERVQLYMTTTNRSISSVELLKCAAAILVNLARYRVTGPKIYARDQIPAILKFMWRFSNSETLLFCKLATFLWLCSKYDEAREDLTEFLQIPENHRMLVTMKGNIERAKRMANNARSKFHTPQHSKCIPRTHQSINSSVSSSSTNISIVMPSLEPDYGIARIDYPRYFEDSEQAINCLFYTFNL